MQLSLQNFASLVEGMAASVQGAALGLLDLSVGSVLRAILEANASVALWIQWLIVQTLATTRLATSAGADVDSFGADFGFARLPATAATGQVTFARFTPSVSAFIAVGTTVSTAANGQSFLVAPDPSNAAYSPGAGGYTLATGIASVNAMVVAVQAGSAGNVQPGVISILNSAVPGVDTVTNAASFSGGIDAESDAAFRSRFGGYLSSLSRATNVAIGAAISAVQQGLSWTINENIDQAGNIQMGHFVVTVDDGSGDPQSGILSAVQQAVDAVRPIGTSFAVQGPVVAAANVSVTLVTMAGTVRNQAIAAVASAVESYIAGLPVGGALSYTKLAQLAYEASGAVSNLSDLLLNGGTTDLVPAQFGVVRTGAVTVS